MTRILLIAFLLFSFPSLAITHPDEKLTNPALEARALKLTKELRCVVCQNESIEESHATIARDLRLNVRKQILDGKSDEDIKIFLRERYGDYILLTPPMDPRTWALWFAPLILLFTGAWMAYASFGKRRRKK